ncbi:MAG: NFACT RNA binding domain-containing protein [Myxococcales bacterium]|nr:NFACT RNA binding domain-containing protein [Myxococcales bacterium]MDH5307661.1 NFACT RNA binding domain-containing protein [Myxococcales bacterium]MDH5566777.1 NFACT RNA binding domain-containing protein [Myxococcales bacterium]
MLSLPELERVAAILDRGLAGHRLQGIVQAGAEAVVLTFYGGRGGDDRARTHILLACGPTSARVAALAEAPRASSAPKRFAQYLRAHVGNARVGGARIVDGDRQLALRLHAREGDFELLLSIFGRRSNLLVLDAEQRVVATLRPLAETRSDLAIGETWRSPASAPPRGGEDRFAEVPEARLLEAIAAHYAGVEHDATCTALARRVELALRKEAKALERKIAKLDAELAGAQAAPRFEREGELLKSALARVRRGDREVVVRDWDSGEEIAIPLDAALAPAENLARIFKRYQKAVRTLTKVGAQRDGVQASRAEIAQLEADYRALVAREDEELGAALERFAERPAMARLLAKLAPGAAAKAAPARRELTLAGRVVPGRLAPRRYRTESGLEVWVGRSDAANDYLSTRLARGKDLFFHLDGAPGSHVVLRTEGRSDPPSEAVLDACELAIHFSKQRNASRADVHVVPIANVRKPKGAKPGLVVVHGGKTIHLRRSPARLERILAARIES